LFQDAKGFRAVLLEPWFSENNMRGKGDVSNTVVVFREAVSDSEREGDRVSDVESVVLVH
jgi:predicted Zn-dependent protease with MMP-like domain